MLPSQFLAHNGQYECINWDLELVPLIGARRLLPKSFEGLDANSTELYIDGGDNYIVRADADYRKITVVSTIDHATGAYFNRKVIAHDYVSRDIHRLVPELEDCIIDASVGRTCRLGYLHADQDQSKMTTLEYLLFVSLLTNSSRPVKFECHTQYFSLLEFTGPRHSTIRIQNRDFPIPLRYYNELAAIFRGVEQIPTEAVYTIAGHRLDLVLVRRDKYGFELEIGITRRMRCQEKSIM